MHIKRTARHVWSEQLEGPPINTTGEELLAPRQKLFPFSTRDKFTPRMINIEPGNDGLEDDFPLPGVYSQVPC